MKGFAKKPPVTLALRVSFTRVAHLQWLACRQSDFVIIAFTDDDTIQKVKVASSFHPVVRA